MVNNTIIKQKKIVLGVTGGIAAYKSVYLLRLLKKLGAEVQIVGTRNSLEFVGKSTWEALSGKMPLFDSFECDDSSKITHITKAQDVDAIVVAPATMNIIGKAAGGICDDLLSTILAAATVPIIFCPGMNSAMFDNPANLRNIEFLKSRKNVYFTDVGEGSLACNDFGKGRMAEPDSIVSFLKYVLTPKYEKKVKWLITAGNTKEYIDPVRFLSNSSSGKMGLAIAKKAYLEVQAKYHPFARAVELAETLDQIHHTLRGKHLFTDGMPTLEALQQRFEKIDSQKRWVPEAYEREPTNLELGLYTLRSKGIKVLLLSIWVYIRRLLAPFFPFRDQPANRSEVFPAPEVP